MKTYTKYAPIAEAIKKIDNAINREKINKVLEYCKEYNFYAIDEDCDYFGFRIEDLKYGLDDNEIIKDHYLKDLPHNTVKTVQNLDLKDWDFYNSSCKIYFDFETDIHFVRLAYCYLIENKKTSTRAFKILKSCLRNGYDLQGQELLGTEWINITVDNCDYELKGPDGEEIGNLYHELADKIRSSIVDNIEKYLSAEYDYFYSPQRFFDDCENNDYLEIEDLLKRLEKEDIYEYREMIKELGNLI
jgi:hypothetical protein